MRLAFVLAVALASGVAAQDGFRGGRQYPPRFANADSFDGGFSFCRLMYSSVIREAGGRGWTTDYPLADMHLSIRLSELTKTRISRQSDGEPNHLVVRPTDEAIFQCPFVQLSDAGTAGFTEEEVASLRAYLLKGGFIWADDFWGERAFEHWRAELARILPPDRYPIVDVPLDHAMYRTMFEIKELPQIPSIRFWRPSGFQTSERGAETATVHFRGIADEHGRLMVFMTHNTDIADAWEREGDDPAYFYAFSPKGYAVGINVLLYTMSH